MFSVFLHPQLLLDPPRVILSAFVLGNGDIHSPSWKSTLILSQISKTWRKKKKNIVKKIKSVESNYCVKSLTNYQWIQPKDLTLCITSNMVTQATSIVSQSQIISISRWKDIFSNKCLLQKFVMFWKSIMFCYIL